MPVGNIAVEVITASRDTPAETLARTRRDEELGDLVIAEGGKPVGVVTDRDVATVVEWQSREYRPGG